MSIFGNILDKIFHHPSATPPASTPVTAPATAAPASTPPSSTAAAIPTVAPVPVAAVDVEAVLTDMAGKAGQPLDWRTSIVDLLKLLQLDSDLASRRELAKELSYSGDMNDSASMNVWLHRQVMDKLAANGGKVPDSLRH